MKVIAGVGRSSIKETIELARYSENLADAIMIIPPYYYKQVSLKGLYEYYTNVSNKIKIPYFIYNIPKYSGISITPELIEKLKGDKNLIGIKDSSGDINTTKEFIQKFPDLIIFGGSDALLLDYFKTGAYGAISALGNVFPSKVSALYSLFKNKKIKEVEKAQEEITKLRKIFKQVQSISAFKLFFQEFGLVKSYVRPPLTNLKEEEFNSLKNQIQTLLN